MSPNFLVVSLSLFAVWCVLLIASRPTRQEQAVMSLVGVVLAPAILFLAMRSGADASRVVGVEDLVFAGSFFGIAAVIYEALFGRHFARLRPARTPARHPVLLWISRLVLAVAIWGAAAVGGVFALGIDLAPSLLVATLLVGVYVIAERKDLLGNALASGACMALLILLIELLDTLRLEPVPLDAFRLSMTLAPAVWAAIAGFAIGPLYEYVRRLAPRR